MAIYFDNSNITTGSRGPEGPQGIQGPQGPAGPNEITTETQTNLTGLLKGNGTNVQLAEAGTDYATPDDTKPFIVTFTTNAGEVITADKTVQEIITAYKAERMVFGFLPAEVIDGGSMIPLKSIMAYPAPHEDDNIVLFSTVGQDSMISLLWHMGTWSMKIFKLVIQPASATVLPASGTALTDNTIYAVADAVGTYAFTPPDTGWAHGMFTTGSSVSVSFSGAFMGAAPTIEASKIYEFDVFDGVWTVQEVVSA